MINPIFIKATTLADAWFQALYSCIDHGRLFKIDKGSFEGQSRLELDYCTIHITYPATEPLMPILNPCLNIPNPTSQKYINEYILYLMTPIKQPNESYTYGNRIHFQLKELIKIYKASGHRNNQMILQVGQPSDIKLDDPPCLRHIDTRIQDGALHFFPYFRSWDLYSGFPTNLAGLEVLKQWCASEIGVDNGEIIASSKGIHLYDYSIPLVEAIRGKKAVNI